MICFGKFLDVALRCRTENLHAIASGDHSQILIVDLSGSYGLGEVIEVPDHGLWHVEIQLLAWRVAHSKSVCDTGGDVDERSGRAPALVVLDENRVFALDDLKRFGSVTMNMDWRSEMRRLRCLEERKRAFRCPGRRLHTHSEGAEVDVATLPRLQNQRTARHIHSLSLSH